MPRENEDEYNVKKIVGIGLGAILIIVVIVSAMWAMNSWISVKVGQALLVVDASNGKVGDPILGPSVGFHIDGFKRMIGQQYPIWINYQVDSVGMWTDKNGQGDYPALTILSKDGLQIEVDIQARWTLNPDGLKAAYEKYPNLNWKTITISSIIREKVRDIIGQYNAIDIIQNRSQISTVLSDGIRQRLVSENTLQGLINGNSLEVDLRNVAPSAAFISAIESKLAAQQALIQAGYQYNTTLVLARADAQSKIIVANGTQQAISIILHSAGTGNSTETAKLAELYLTLEAYKTMAPDVKQFIIITGQGTPIVYPITGSNSTIP